MFIPRAVQKSASKQSRPLSAKPPSGSSKLSRNLVSNEAKLQIVVDNGPSPSFRATSFEVSASIQPQEDVVSNGAKDDEKFITEHSTGLNEANSGGTESRKEASAGQYANTAGAVTATETENCAMKGDFGTKDDKITSVDSREGMETVQIGVNSVGDEAKEDDVMNIVARSYEQRTAKEDEPVCVVCGRFGEYVCDLTDDDICSLECKAVVLERARVSPAEIGAAISAVSNPNSSHFQSFSTSPVLSDIQGHPDIQTPASCKKITATKDDADHKEANDTKIRVDNIWQPHPYVLNLTAQQVENIRAEMEINVRGTDVPPPILDFLHCQFSDRLQANLEKANYEIPTPIQMQVIPSALQGRHIMASAHTGSGKTAAFLLPIIHRISTLQTEEPIQSPLALVLGPTRELCVQIESQAKELAKGLPIRTALIVGGIPLPQQIHRLKQGCQLIVATPGRLIDVLVQFQVPLDDVRVLVLDEVDALLEMGFREQVMQVVIALSAPQLLFFSATIPPSIEKFAASLLQRPIHISVGQLNAPSRSVKQTVIWCENRQKKQKLFEILLSSRHFHPPTLVIVESKLGADILAKAIHTVTGLQALCIHGDKPMSERRTLLKQFILGEVPVMVSTGILGRGLDLVHVKQVILFDLPNSVEEYVHQVGRAGRLGRHGSAIAFVNSENRRIFGELVPLLKEGGCVVPREILHSMSLPAVGNSSNKNCKRKGR